MRAGLPQRPQAFDVAVLADIIMIAGAGKAAAKVVGGKVMLRVATVGTGGGAVDDDKVDGSHDGNRIKAPRRRVKTDKRNLYFDTPASKGRLVPGLYGKAGGIGHGMGADSPEQGRCQGDDYLQDIIPDRRFLFHKIQSLGCWILVRSYSPPRPERGTRGLSQRVLVLVAVRAAAGVPAVGVPAAGAGVFGLVEGEQHVGGALGLRVAAVHKAEALVRRETDVHPADVTNGTFLSKLHARAAEGHVESTQLVQPHLVAVGQVTLDLLHQRLDDVLHVAAGHGTVLLDVGGQHIDINGAASLGFLTEIIQQRGLLVTHDSSAPEALYDYVHNFVMLRVRLKKYQIKKVGKRRDKGAWINDYSFS